jgi:hypothetical protein
MPSGKFKHCGGWVKRSDDFNAENLEISALRPIPRVGVNRGNERAIFVKKATIGKVFARSH